MIKSNCCDSAINIFTLNFLIINYYKNILDNDDDVVITGKFERLDFHNKVRFDALEGKLRI